MKYRVGDMFLVHHGNSYSRGVIIEIEKECDTANALDECRVAWFDSMVSGHTFRKVGYSFFEIKNILRRKQWEHYPVGK
jgi:hypothetical protein